MAFSRDDLVSYEKQTQVQVEKHDPWTPRDTQDVLNPEADLLAKADASTDPSSDDVTEPADQVNDGSTTETKAESVAAKSANPEGDKDPELEDLADGKPRSRAQERIEELVAERNALRDYGKYLLSQVEGQRKAPAQAETVSRTEATEDADDTAPTLESAEFDPVRLNHMQNQWIQKQVDKRVEQAVKQIEVRQSENQIRQTFESRIAEFKKSTPDFDTIISNPALPQLAPQAARVVIQSENGPAIAYHLARNPDLAVRIARMEPVSQAVAIGRLEEQLLRTKADLAAQKEPSKDTKQAVRPASVTKAPPPPKPVSGGTSPVQKDVGLMSMEDWVANERSKKISERQARIKLRNAMR